MLKKLIFTLSSILLCAAANGCFVADHSATPAPAVGTLTTTWTLDGSADAGACAYYQVDRVHVVIADDSGVAIADEEPFCEDFGVSFDLSIGWYSSEVTLLEVSGYAVSDTIITDVRVLRDTETFVDVDFPDGSIL